MRVGCLLLLIRAGPVKGLLFGCFAQAAILVAWVNGYRPTYIVRCHHELAIVADADIAGRKTVGRLPVKESEPTFRAYFVAVNVATAVGSSGHQFAGGVEHAFGSINRQVGGIFNAGSSVGAGKKTVLVWSEGVNPGGFAIHVPQLLRVGADHQHGRRRGFSSGGLIR